jgi:nitrogen fixation protein FixH
MRRTENAPFTLTGLHMIAMFVAFFAVVIGVNLVMARAAVVNWTGLVVKNSYVASQEFNDKIKAHDVIAARGWRESAAAANGALVWAIVDAEGKPVQARKLTIKFTRPIGEKDDATVIAGPNAAGLFDPVPFPAAGRWVATIRAEIDGVEDFESIHRFDVRKGA